MVHPGEGLAKEENKMMEYIKSTLVILAVLAVIGLFTTFVESI